MSHTSLAGDLHEVGRCFAGFLETYLAGGPYEWLADLAALEWAVAEAGVAADAAAAPASSLAALEPEAVAQTRLRLAPSLQRVSARVPVLAVWQANQPGEDRSAIDLGAGPQFVLVHRTADGVQLRDLLAGEFAFVDAIACGATLEAALDASALPLGRLPALLHALFADGVVAEVVAPG